MSTTGMDTSFGTAGVEGVAEVTVVVAAEVAATVGKVDSDVVAHTESPLDEFGRMKAVVVGSP